MMRRSWLRTRTPLRRRTPLRPRAKRRKSIYIVCEEYKAFVRSHGCLVASGACFGPVGCHHVGRYGQARRNDFATVPLCWGHHLAGANAVHNLPGRDRAFQALYGVSFSAATQGLNAEWESLGKELL